MSTTADVSSSVSNYLPRINAATRGTLKAQGTPQQAPELMRDPYYHRDFGTYYINYRREVFSGGVGQWVDGMYLMTAPFTQLMFTNMASDKSKTVFKCYNSFYKVYIDFAKDIFDNYSMTPTKGSNYYIPMVMPSEGEPGDTFYVGRNIGYSDYVYTTTRDTMGGELFSLTDNYYAYGYFADFGVGTEGSFYGSNRGNTPIGHCTRVYQYYPKPIKPLAISKIKFSGYSFNRTDAAASILPFDGDGCLTISILRGDNPNGTDIIAQMKVDNSNIVLSYYDDEVGATYHEIEATPADADGEGNIVAKPFVVDDEYTLVIDGFSPDKADIGIGNTDQSKVYWDGDRSDTAPVRPTHAVYTDGTDYTMPANNARIYFDGCYDVANVIGSTTLTAPAAGGACTFEASGNTYYGPQVQTSHAYINSVSGEPNYRLENLPEWLTIERCATNNYTSSGSWTQVFVVNAEALPAGLSGRTAQVKVVSDLGACSQVITFLQGDATGITTIDDKADNTGNAAVYNLAGQRVGADWRGIVVQNGKKLLRR